MCGYSDCIVLRHPSPEALAVCISFWCLHSLIRFLTLVKINRLSQKFLWKEKANFDLSYFWPWCIQMGKIQKFWPGESILLGNFAPVVCKVSLQDFFPVLVALWPEILFGVFDWGATSSYRGWPRITEQTLIVDSQHPLSTSGKNTHILWFISFPTGACWLPYIEREARYSWLPKVCWCTPTVNDCACRESEKWFSWLIKHTRT